MIPRIIHKIWIGGKPIPPEYLEWNDRLKDINPDFKIQIWNEDSLKEDAYRIDELKKEFWSPASISNFMRLCVVHEYGGIYMDMDFEPVSPLVRLMASDKPFAAIQDGDRICNAFFGAPPQDRWLEWQIRSFDKHGYDLHDAAWGVYLMSKAPRENLWTMPQHWVYPFHYDDPTEIRKNKIKDDTMLIHHWGGSWTKQP